MQKKAIPKVFALCNRNGSFELKKGLELGLTIGIKSNSTAQAPKRDSKPAITVVLE